MPPTPARRIGANFAFAEVSAKTFTMDKRCTGNRLTVKGGLMMFGFGGGLYNDIESNWQQDIIASNRRMQVKACNKTFP
jgi:hypothetical protein